MKKAALGSEERDRPHYLGWAIRHLGLYWLLGNEAPPVIKP
jgi:hypothetical protein